MLSLIAPPAGTIVTLDEAKAQARVEVDADDVLIQALLATAVEHAEWYTQRALLPQQWALYLDSFPRGRVIELPKPPLISVDEITYLDQGGDEQVLDVSAYRAVVLQGPMAEKGRVLLRNGQAWPFSLDEPAAVTVRFTAGYDEYDGGVPEQIRQAIKMHVAELYENRESTVLTGAVIQEVPFSVRALLWPYVVEKFGLG